VHNDDERLAWMIVIGTIPVGLAGLALEHTFRTVLGRPIPAAIFLMINGLVLFAAEGLRRRAAQPPPAVHLGHLGQMAGAVPTGPSRGTVYVGQSHRPAAKDPAADAEKDRASDSRIARRSFKETTAIASAQILALLPGISRSGVTMAAGLFRGLSHVDAARFSFLLATPVILAAGMLKVPSDLFGPVGAGIHGQVLAGSIASFVAAYLSVRFLTRYFETRTLIPFAIYCLAAGAASLAWLALR
jgi:undecaprenyl-diphosphatase